MKKQLLYLLFVSCACSSVFAQDNIKRPDSYYYQSGVDALNEGDYQKSLDFFDKELEQNPKNGYAMLWKAYIYHKYEMYGKAVTCTENAMKYVPKKDKEWYALCYSIRADVQAELGDTVQALDDYNTAFKIFPKDKHIFDRCNILHRQHKYAEIDKDLQRAYQIDANSAVLYVYMGRNEDAKQQYDKAIEKYNYAVKLDPNYSSAYSFRAETYINMHKYREACQDAISCLNIDANDTKSYFQLYSLADSAINFLAPQLKAQQLKDPNNSMWSYYLGLVYAHLDNYAAAESAFREAKRISEYEGRHSTVLLNNLSETLNKLGKNKEALEISDLCLSQDSTKERTYRDRAQIYYDMGKNMQAIDCMSKAISLEPENDILYCTRARYYMYNNMLRNALDDINVAISLDSEYSYYLNQRSEIYARMNRKNESDEDCRAIIKMETAKPEDFRNLQSLAYAYIRLGDKANALPVMEKVYADQYRNGSEYDKACMYSLIDYKEQALAHFENALSLGYCEFAHIDNDTDLNNIRETEKFKALIKEYKVKYTEGEAEGAFDEGEYIEETSEVPFVKESGIYKVKCTINDLPLHFFFDTGASDVTISSVEAQFMLKNDYLKPSDLKGKEYYGTASGEIAEGTVVLLKRVKFGDLELTNVKASVVHNQNAPLLLGQSVLSRLGKIEIDYDKSALKITRRVKK